ncbi:hypothetical protein EI983_01260 [Roseovarius faecimaris]|uniref:DUF4239 domain-containing protein n=1 Tax=Roseovarius faecimaris TaxID=2494550 RepID=A0A6I6IL05_9RHOB|nr:hypothetical protein [Roseovarius faecimaris]QGX96972.1 hypothetical protein EI983_01260 [Roseovarius faecimaris]
MGFIIDNQLIFLTLFFFAGCVGTAVLLRRRAGHRAWLIADLIWVVLGGLGALGAVLAGVYKADSGQINRQIDVAYAASAAFDRDAARFRLSYCEAPLSDQIVILCDKADFLAASTAENADLPLFIAITGDVSPLSSLRLFGGGEAAQEMMKMADAFDPEQFLVFTARNEETDKALQEIRSDHPQIAADFNILASSYEALIAQVAKLKDEWEFLQANAYILLIQIIALCLVSFAAPFRLGKSVVDIRDR